MLIDFSLYWPHFLCIPLGNKSQSAIPISQQLNHFPKHFCGNVDETGDKNVVSGAERGSLASPGFLCTYLSPTGLAEHPSFPCSALFHLLLLVSHIWSLTYSTHGILFVCVWRTLKSFDCYWDFQWP